MNFLGRPYEPPQDDVIIPEEKPLCHIFTNKFTPIEGK